MRPCLVLLALMASAAFAQTASNRPGNEIVVNGRNDARLRTYVDRMARPVFGHQIARWHSPLCIEFDRMDPTYSDYIRTRLLSVAKSVGLAGDKSPCPTNILIALSDNADLVTRSLVHSRPPHIGNLTNDALLPKREVDALLAPQTVRWLTASATTSRDGVPMMEGTMKVSDSLIRSSVRENLVSKIIIIDSARLSGVTLSQLSDYIAFVTLASPDVAANYSGSDSIMALFVDGDAAPKSMTSQDRAYLDALYTSPAARTANAQKGSIRSRMKRASADTRQERPATLPRPSDRRGPAT